MRLKPTKMMHKMHLINLPMLKPHYTPQVRKELKNELKQKIN